MRSFQTAISLLVAIALLATCGSGAPPELAAPTTTPEPATPTTTTEPPATEPRVEPQPTESTDEPLPTAPTAKPEPPTPQPTPTTSTTPEPTTTISTTPEATPTAPQTPKPTSNPTATPAPTPEPTPTISATPAPTPEPTPTISATPEPSLSGKLAWQVLASYPHDTTAFTQGLLWHEGLVYESTGLRGQSVLRTVDLPTGRVLREAAGEPQYFGEGLALVDDRLIWLTWQAGIAGVYHRDTLEPEGGFSYSGEGWGLCHDGTRLVMSDGSNTLTFRHPETFEVLGSVRVTHTDGQPVNHLNELECVGDYVWANVWLTNLIVVIDPDTGAVAAEADMSDIIIPHPSIANSNDVLNGIAYRPDTATFLITGKRWPTMFEVSFENQR